MLRTVFVTTLLFTGIVAWGQVNFNSDDPNFIKYYGGQNQPVYYSFGEATAHGKEATKLVSRNEFLQQKVKKFKKLTQLQILLLENNAIADLPAEIGYMQNLFILSSKKNKIIYIDPAIAKCHNMLYLELYNTKLDSLPTSIQHMRHLELLRIGDNESDTLRLPEELTYLRGLRDLQLFDCNIYRLPQNMQNFDAMERLVLAGCKLDTLPGNFGYMPRLKHLDLQNNAIKEFPASFTKLRSLEYLTLRNNRLTSLPEGFVWFTKLQTLDVRGNTIPEQQLEILRLSLPNCRIIKDPPPKK